MDIINKIHTCFRECEYFEFGEGFVKFYDKDQKKYFVVRIEEAEIKKCAETQMVSATQINKTTKVTPKERKTWESIIKAKSKKL